MRTKPTYLFAVALVLAAFCSINTQAQEQEYVAPKVVISKERVRSSGKIYYAHVVQEKQTLYSISKAYIVSFEEIYKAKPFMNLETEGLKKGQILLIPYDEERAKEINPDCVIRTYKTFYLPETQDQFDFSEYDYVVDAIDTVTGKLTIIENAKRAGVPVISSMGAGNKVNPVGFEVADIYDTSVCPLAKVMRRECKKRGIDALKVVYSKEPPVRPLTVESEDSSEKNCISPEADGEFKKRRSTPGSTAFVPSVAGLIIAGEIINDLSGKVPFPKR